MNIQKEWFIPGDGIDRQVISSDIQRYLGNDATVRPGLGTGEQAGISGYWVRAYRTLTTAMVDDLKESSARWMTEQRKTGSRAPYHTSGAYVAAGNGMPQRPAGDSPLGPMAHPHNEPVARGNRIPDPMAQGRRMQYPEDRMPVDPTYNQVPPRGYPQDRMDYDDMNYGPPHGRDPGYAGPPQGRDPRDRQFVEGRDYPPQGFQGQDSRYGGRAPGPDMRERVEYRDARGFPVNGPDFGRQPDYNPGPPNVPYGGPMHVQPRAEAYANPQFGVQPRDRDPRFPSTAGNFAQERDPRDARYAYPSPAQSNPDTVQQHNAFGHGGPNQGNIPPQYDQYGGRPQQPPMNAGFQPQPGQAGPMPGQMPGPIPGVRPPQSGLGSRPAPPPEDYGMARGDNRKRRHQ